MTVGISNSAVADVLERHGRLLEISGESPFRKRAFTRAAESLRLHPERVVELAAVKGYLGRSCRSWKQGASTPIVSLLTVSPSRSLSSPQFPALAPRRPCG